MPLKLLQLPCPSLGSKVMPVHFRVNTTRKTAEEKMH